MVEWAQNTDEYIDCFFPLIIHPSQFLHFEGVNMLCEVGGYGKALLQRCEPAFHSLRRRLANMCRGRKIEFYFADEVDSTRVCPCSANN